MSSFECALDGTPFTECSSPYRYNASVVGQHQLQVRAVDALGAADPTPALTSWGQEPIHISHLRFRKRMPTYQLRRLLRRRAVMRCGWNLSCWQKATKRYRAPRLTWKQSRAGEVVLRVRLRGSARVRKIAISGQQGSNRFIFSGKLGKQRLRRGRYIIRLDAVAGKSITRSLLIRSRLRR